MDQKTWLWRKRYSDKTVVANEKSDTSLKGIGQERQPNENEIALGKSGDIINEKLASVLCECDAKDELIAKHARMEHEAIAGWAKAEAEVVYLKKELDEALQQKVAANERLTHLNAALKDCMKLLSSVRKEQEQQIHDTVLKTSHEFEKANKKLEVELSETCKSLANLTLENSHLSMALLVKEKLIEDFTTCKSQAEAEFNTLMARLDSTEKENAFLKYEFRMLEKELEIRNEDIEFSLRAADTSHKQHLESVKKIKKLEAECQRLRLLVRKRLPGPAAVAKMCSEVEIQGRSHIETRRKKLNLVTGSLVVRDSTPEECHEIPSRKTGFLIERLHNLEEENKILKEVLAKKDNEICYSRAVWVETASKLSQVEAHLAELSNARKPMRLALTDNLPNELSLTVSDVGKDDAMMHSGSQAFALSSKLEHFRNGNPRNTSESKMIGVSDMSLMDDFVEMEKLAIVAVDASPRNSYGSLDPNHMLSDSLTESRRRYWDSTGKELVPVVEDDANNMERELQTRNIISGKSRDWIQDVLKVILEQICISKISVDEILEDIRIASHYLNHPGASEAYRAGSSKDPKSSEPLPISGYITWKSPNSSPRMGSIRETPDIGALVEETNDKHIHSNLSRSIFRIIELIRRIDPTCSEDCTMEENFSDRDQSTLPCMQFTAPNDYLVRVFRWKSFELHNVLGQFVRTCNALLDGKANFEKFTEELTSALCWIMNNCIPRQDVSSVGDKIKKQFCAGGSGRPTEFGSVLSCLSPRLNEVYKSEEQPSFFPLVTTSSNVQNLMLEMEKIHSNLREENEELKEELKNVTNSQKDLEARLQSANEKREALTNQLCESEHSIGSLQSELETMKEYQGMVEDQIENQKFVNEDLDTQLTVAKIKLNEVLQKLSSLEVELEDRSHCCEELEGTCLELQLQLESITNKEVREEDRDHEGKLLQTGWEITAASAKLAECQETIFNLGKQLKSLASPKEAAVFDKVFSTTSTNKKKLRQRSSLRDQMLSEHGAEIEDLETPKTKEIISSIETKRPATCASNVHVAPPDAYPELTPDFRISTVGPLAVVPSKKRGGKFSLLTKILLRRKRGSGRNTSVPFAT